MPKPLTLFEHEAGEFSWTDRDLALLQHMRLQTGAEVLRATTRNGKRVLQASQHVGVIQLGYQTIQILPKIYQAGDSAPKDVRIKEATSNLLRLLNYAGELPIREHEIAPLVRQTDNWFEILTRLFATRLLEQWQRGPYRTYQSFNDRLPVLRGKWRMAEQLRRPDLPQTFAVEFDEFTADNQLNRVFRYVIEKLWKLTRDNDNRQILGELRQWLEEVTLLPAISSRHATSAQLTRLNEHYRPLLTLAQLFLDGGSLRLSAGDLSSFSFVFDMNQLFEKFIAEFIRRNSTAILPEELQSCKLLPQTRGASLHLARRDHTNVFQTRPDIAFVKEKEFRLLVDTKYKRLNDSDKKLGVVESDFYQMHAYAHRYMCSRVILLYPQFANAAEQNGVPFQLENCNHRIEVGTVNLRINLNNQIERNALIDQLRNLLSQGQTP
jgi:5-methylcytosine-specific restriction enzyme subunit McrC